MEVLSYVCDVCGNVCNKELTIDTMNELSISKNHDGCDMLKGFLITPIYYNKRNENIQICLDCFLKLTGFEKLHYSNRERLLEFGSVYNISMDYFNMYVNDTIDKKENLRKFKESIDKLKDIILSIVDCSDIEFEIILDVCNKINKRVCKYGFNKLFPDMDYYSGLILAKK